MKKVLLFIVMFCISLTVMSQTYSKELEKKAKGGDVVSQREVGVCYLKGLGTETNYKKAKKWLNKAAVQDPAAQYYLAGMYLNNQIEVKDNEREKGKDLLRQAAESGLSEAQLMYGDQQTDNVERFKWYYKAAAQGNETAKQKIEEYAQNGIAEAEYYYAEMQTELSTKLSWYKKAAEQGHKEAKQKIEELERKAKNGDSEAQYYYADLQSDLSTKLSWYKKAAEQGHNAAKQKIEEYAQNEIAEGEFYYAELLSDQEEKLKWYRKAAKQGHNAAKQKIEEYAQNGITKAEYYYAELLSDQEEKLKWYKKAAEQGHAEANFIVGLFYYDGRGGLDKNASEAKKWFMKAKELGSYSPVSYLDKMKREEDIAAGRILPGYKQLISGCTLFPMPEGNTYEQIWNGAVYKQYCSLCENDMLKYYQKNKLSGLDLELYKRSEQYKRDYAAFQSKKDETYAIVFPASLMYKMIFNSDEFSIYDQNPDFIEQNKYVNIGRTFLIPVNSGKLHKKNHFLIFKCNDINKLLEMRSHEKDLALVYIFKPGIKIDRYFASYKKLDTSDFYLSNPVGLYIANTNTGETILSLNDHIRKPNLEQEKKQMASTSKAQAQKKLKGMYHKTPRQEICVYCRGTGYGYITPIASTQGRCWNCKGRGYTLEYFY